MTIVQARLAKQKAKAMFRGCSIGIAKVKDQHGLLIKLPSNWRGARPYTIENVPVIYETQASIKPR